MDWKLFWKVVRITFGVVFIIASVYMLFQSLFGFDQVDFAYCMVSVFTLFLGIIMAVFGISTLPGQNKN